VVVVVVAVAVVDWRPRASGSSKAGWMALGEWVSRMVVSATPVGEEGGLWVGQKWVHLNGPGEVLEC